jgi:hypothetical protein
MEVKMQNRLCFSKIRMLSLAIVFSVIGLSIPAKALDQTFKNCNFQTYSVDERDTGGSTPDLATWPYSIATLQPVLKLISPNNDLKLAKFGEADVSITYLVDDSWYKTAFTEKHPTILDLLAAFPNSQTDVRTLTSPWLRVRLTIDCKLIVVFIYNQRQIIADQAFLDGVRPLVKGIVSSSTERMRNWPVDYEKSVIYLEGHPKGMSNIGFRDYKEISKRQEYVKQLIAHQYPSDLFWLLSSVRSNHLRTDTGAFSFKLYRILSQLITHADIRQVNLMLTLAQQFLSKESKSLVYNSIVDVSSLVDLKTYRVKQFD